MGRLKVTVSANCLIRKSVESGITSLCNTHNISLQMKEIRGILSSDFVIRAEGSDKAIVKLADFIEENSWEE